MSNQDFDPKAFVNSDFDPQAFLDAPSAPPPTAKITVGPKLSRAEHLGEAATAPWTGTRDAFLSGTADVNRYLNPFSEEHGKDQDAYFKELQAAPWYDPRPTLKSVGRAGKGLLGVLGAAISPLAGAERTVGHVASAALPGERNQEEAQEVGAQLLSGLRPKTVPTKVPGIGPSQPGQPIAPNWAEVSPTARATPPAPPPDGVLLSEGQRTGELSKIQAEQGAYRGEKGQRAQDRAVAFFEEQQPAQVAAEKSRVGTSLAPQSNHFLTADEAAQGIADYLTQQRSQRAAGVTQVGQLLNAARETLRAMLSPNGRVLAETPTEAASIISGGVARAEEQARDATTAAYRAFEQLPGQFHPAAFNKVAGEIKNIVARPEDPTQLTRINPQTTPQANTALGDLQDILGGVSQRRDPETGRVMPRTPVTPALVENARKRLNTFYGNALAAARASNNWSDVHAMEKVMDAFDNIVTKKLQNSFSGGDPADVVSAIGAARALHRQHRQTFFSRGAGDTVGPALQKIIGRHDGQALTPEQVEGLLFGSNGVPLGRRLIEVFGRNSDEVGAVKQGLFSHILEAPPGTREWTPAKVADRIEMFTQGKGRSLTELYLSPDEIAQLRGYGRQYRAHGDRAGRMPDRVDRLFDTITGTDTQAPASIDYTAKKLFKSVLDGAQDAPEIIRRIYQNGPDTPQAGQFRQGLLRTAIEKGHTEEGYGPKKIASNIKELLNSEGGKLAFPLPEQRQLLRGLADLHDKLVIPQRGANWSGTGAAEKPMLDKIVNTVTSLAAYTIAHATFPGGMGGIPELITAGVAHKLTPDLAARRAAKQMAKQLPLVAEQVADYQKKLAAYNRSQNPITNKALTFGATNLTRSLSQLGVDVSKIPQLQFPGLVPAEEDKKRAEGGAVENDLLFEVASLQPYDQEAPSPTVTGHPYVETPTEPAPPVPEPSAFEAAAARVRRQHARRPAEYNQMLAPGVDEQRRRAYLKAEMQRGEAIERGEQDPLTPKGVDKAVRQYQTPFQADPNADAFEAAAYRQRRAARPGDRAEGATTKVLDHLGEELGHMLARPARIIDALKEVPGGQPLSERPDIVDAGAATALDIVGLPGIMGRSAVPDALTAGATRPPGWKTVEGGSPEKAPSGLTNKDLDEVAESFFGKKYMELPPGNKREVENIAKETGYATEPPTALMLEHPQGPTESAWDYAVRLNDIEAQAKEVDKFRQGFVGDVTRRAQENYARGQQYHEEGKLPFPVGTRFTTEHSREKGMAPWRVTGYHIDPKNPEKYGYSVERGKPDTDGWERSVLLVNHPTNPSIAKLAQKYEPFEGPKALFSGDQSGAATAASAADKVQKALTAYKPAELSTDVGEFLKLSQQHEAKHGKNWVDKLSPQELADLKSSPVLSKALANIQAAKEVGVFEKVFQAPATRREAFSRAAGLVSAVSNASKLGKLLEQALEVPKVPLPDPVAGAYETLKGLGLKYKELDDDLMTSYWRAEHALTEPKRAEKNAVYEKYEDLPHSKQNLEKRDAELAAIDARYASQEGALRSKMREQSDALRKEAAERLAAVRQDLNLPKLNEEQQKVLDYVVKRPHGDKFTDASIRQNPYELAQDFAKELESARRVSPEAEKALLDYYERRSKGDHPAYLLYKMTPEQKAQIAEHIKPALLQDEHLSLRDARTIAKAFPSLKGFSLFANKSGELGALGLYSAVERAIEKLPDAKLTAEQWFDKLWTPETTKTVAVRGPDNKSTGETKTVTVQGQSPFPGVKKEELEWLGLGDLKGPMTKDELLEHVRAGGPGLKEVELGAPDPKLSEKSNALVNEWNALRQQGLSAEDPRLVAIREELNALQEELADAPKTRYGGYQLPGGENYREIVLTLPNRPWDEASIARKTELSKKSSAGTLTARENEELNALIEKHEGSGYKSKHWPDENNPILHIRANDRTLPGEAGGKNQLSSFHLEELQSDWHQAGRKKGYGPKIETHYEAYYETPPPYTRRIPVGYGKTKEEALAQAGDWPRILEESGLPPLQFSERKEVVDQGVPDAPFKTSWPDLGLRRAIVKAADEGYDAISWTPGVEQAKRYSLEKHLSKIEYQTKFGDLTAYDKNGHSVIVKSKVSPEELPEYIGKEAADRLLNNPTHKHENGMFHTLSGLDLKVGGEGMKAFYDKMLVDKANAIGKKYGAKVEWKETPIAVPEERLRDLFDELKQVGFLAGNTRYADFLEEWRDLSPANQRRWADRVGVILPEKRQIKVPVLRITPELKKAALENGLPLFSNNAGKAGAAAAATSEFDLRNSLRDLSRGSDAAMEAAENGLEGYYTATHKLYRELIKSAPPEARAPRGFTHDPDPYVPGMYQAVNGALRGRFEMTPGVKKMIDRLDVATRSLKLPEGIKVYRGLLNGDRLNKTDPGFFSTSTTFSDAYKFATGHIGDMGGRVLEITVPKGATAAVGNIKEHELIFPRGSKILLDGSVHTYDSGQLRLLRGRLVLPKARATGGAVGSDQEDEVPRPPAQQDHPYEPQVQQRAAGGRVLAAEINPNPTEAQKAAGNYAKSRLSWEGLPITIENAQGSWRAGVSRNGKPWRCRVPADYGYVRRSEGADGDHVDIYLGPNRRSPKIFVIDQIDRETGKFDEHKILAAFGSVGHAVNTYKRGFSDGLGGERIGAVTTLSVDQLKAWLRDGDTTKPLANLPKKAFALN